MYASFENIEVQKKDSNHWLIKKNKNIKMIEVSQLTKTFKSC